MASNHPPQPDDLVSTTPGPSQEIPQQSSIQTSSVEPSEAVEASPPSESVQQENAATEAPSTKPADNEDAAVTATLQHDNPDTVAASSENSLELKVAAAAPDLSSKQSDASLKESEDSGPSLTITLLLITGSRHPFKIDGKYLRKRAVNVENYDPFAMSVYTLKELIWREWRQDWEPRPSSPSSIRLISFGKLLDDKAPLSDSKFSRDAPNVVHMTVKPQEIVDEEDAKGAKTQYARDREASERSPRCRCVIQ